MCKVIGTIDIDTLNTRLTPSRGNDFIRAPRRGRNKFGMTLGDLLRGQGIIGVDNAGKLLRKE